MAQQALPTLLVEYDQEAWTIPSACNRYHRLMTMSLEAGSERVELAPAAALFRSLVDPTRLSIVRRLTAGPARVVDLVEALGLAQSTVSEHLGCLRACRLVESEPVGRVSVFRLAESALVELLLAAETVLSATGNAVDLCPNYGRSTVDRGLVNERVGAPRRSCRGFCDSAMPPMTRSKRFAVALMLNLVLVAGLVTVGVTAHSLGVLAAGGDYLADAAAIGIAIVAIQLSDRHPRANAFAALVNGSWLLVLSISIVAGGVDRLVSGTPAVHGLPVLVMSAIAAAVMTGAAVVLGVDVNDDDGDEALSHRAVLLDTAADATSASGVATTGAIIFAPAHRTGSTPRSRSPSR